MDNSESDKSEQATPFKLRKAREKGAVARSPDAGFVAAVLGLLAFLWMSGQHLASALAQSARAALNVAPHALASASTLGEISYQVIEPAMWPLGVFAVSLLAIALLLDFIQIGPIFSTTPLKPDLDRINPAKGLKRLFSWRAVTEAMKASLKLAIYAFIAWLVIGFAVRSSILPLAEGASVAGALLSGTRRLLLYFALAAFGFAILDQVLVRRAFAKKMRMSRREVKREFRDREGDPRFKQKRRQVHAEFAKAVKALRAVRGADIVITNPTHIAVALRYDRDSMNAPRVVARGAGEMARRIRRLAFTYRVTIASDPPLARALYRAAPIDAEVPAGLFQKVADLYLRHGLAKGPPKPAEAAASQEEDGA
jgi:flagellar biosynthetic protein FlhB